MSGLNIQKSKLLLCEGKDEFEFFTALLKHVGRADVQVIQVGGKYNFTPKIAILVQDSSFPQITDILIVRDADCVVDGAGFAATWSSVTNTLRHHNLPMPAAHCQFTVSSPRVAVFIMPDGTSDGMLETLCVAAIQSDPATPCVREYFTCLLTAKAPGQPHLPRNQDKAFIRVFLASRSEPDKVVGQAAQAGYWQWTDAAFAPLIDLLRQL
jgi:hypothetical protein